MLERCRYCNQIVGYDGMLAYKTDGDTVYHVDCKGWYDAWKVKIATLDVFLRDRRHGMTRDDLGHIGQSDKERIMSIVFCPVCGLDGCSPLCNLPREQKLVFTLREGVPSSVLQEAI